MLKHQKLNYQNYKRFENMEMKLDYDEVSPVTGNNCVIVEADPHNGENSRLCMESGYTTKDSWKTGSEVIEKYEEHITQLMRDLKHEDDDLGLTWYPSTMVTGTTMLYPKGETNEDWVWEVVKVVPIVGDERLNYPVPGTEDQYYTSRVDLDNAKQYAQAEFVKALDDFYANVMEAYAPTEEEVGNG